MPYDEAERTWKIRILGPDGKPDGFVEPGYFQKSRDGEEEFTQFKWFKTWRGKSQGAYTEVLYRQEWKDEDPPIKSSYFLLYRNSNDYFTDDDYGRSLTRQQAAEWLIQERYNLPDDLADEHPQNLPLPDSQQEVWDLLNGEILTAKELAKLVSAAPVSLGSIIKLIQAIRKNGREIVTKRGVGYYRPDAPPEKS